MVFSFQQLKCSFHLSFTFLLDLSAKLTSIILSTINYGKVVSVVSCPFPLWMRVIITLSTNIYIRN